MAATLTACSPPPTSVEGNTNPSLSPTSVTAESGFPVGRELRDRIGLGSLTDLFGRVYNEQQRRIRFCMKGRGFDYSNAAYVDSEAELARLQNPLNESTAKTYGYHVPPLPATVPPTVPNNAFAKALSGDGTSNDPGCAGSPAVKQLRDVSNPSFNLYADLMFSLDQATESKFFSSTEFATLSQDWSKCMRALGYQYEGWFAPLTEFSTQPSVTSEEIAVRLQDLACDRQVGLTESRSKAEQADFEQWMAKQQLQIQRLLDLIAVASKAVARLESQQL